MTFKFMPVKENLVDCLTKAVPRPALVHDRDGNASG